MDRQVERRRRRQARQPRVGRGQPGVAVQRGRRRVGRARLGQPQPAARDRLVRAAERRRADRRADLQAVGDLGRAGRRGVDLELVGRRQRRGRRGVVQRAREVAREGGKREDAQAPVLREAGGEARHVAPGALDGDRDVQRAGGGWAQVVQRQRARGALRVGDLGGQRLQDDRGQVAAVRPVGGAPARARLARVAAGAHRPDGDGRVERGRCGRERSPGGPGLSHATGARPRRRPPARAGRSAARAWRP